MQKVRYELDPYNRIVLGASGQKSDARKFRQVIDGSFRVDKSNNLSYHVKSPLSSSDVVPNQLKLKGEWTLTDKHELRLMLDKSTRETFGDQLTLQGKVLSVNKNSVSFELISRSKEGEASSYVINLEGVWQADQDNRLCFHIKKDTGKYDILTFNGEWSLGKNHQIIYSYEKADLIRKNTRIHTLIFKGYWDILDKTRVSYVLIGNTDSSFDFSVMAKVFNKNYIQYEIAISLAGKSDPVERIVKLSGKWNLKKGLGLVFETDYGSDGIKRMVFGAEASLTDKDTVSFKLKKLPRNVDLGGELKISRKVLKGDGEAFVRILSSRSEQAIFAGAACRW